MTIDKTLDQIAREEVERIALEAAAKKIEGEHVGRIYAFAFKRAARIVRSLKPG